MPRAAHCVLAVLAAALVLAGCAGPSPKPARADAFARVAARHPRGGYRLQQRIAMKALGKEYPMLAYLAVAGDGRFRAQAFSEMGGLMFDLVGDTASARVLFKPDPIGERPLLEGVAGDIRALYLGGDPGGRSLALSADGSLELENPSWHYRLWVRDLKELPGEPPASSFRQAAMDGEGD